MSITRIPDIAKGLGKAAGGLAAAVVGLADAAAEWNRFCFPDSELQSARNAVARAVAEIARLQLRFNDRADGFYSDDAAGPGLFPPGGDPPHGTSTPPAPEASSPRRGPRSRSAEAPRDDL